MILFLKIPDEIDPKILSVIFVQKNFYSQFFLGSHWNFSVNMFRSVVTRLGSVVNGTVRSANVSPSLQTPWGTCINTY